jgi:hypothetical protein
MYRFRAVWTRLRWARYMPKLLYDVFSSSKIWYLKMNLLTVGLLVKLLEVIKLKRATENDISLHSWNITYTWTFWISHRSKSSIRNALENNVPRQSLTHFLNIRLIRLRQTLTTLDFNLWNISFEETHILHIKTLTILDHIYKRNGSKRAPYLSDGLQTNISRQII